jgi:hypothetical protein
VCLRHSTRNRKPDLCVKRVNYWSSVCVCACARVCARVRVCVCVCVCVCVQTESETYVAKKSINSNLFHSSSSGSSVCVCMCTRARARVCVGVCVSVFKCVRQEKGSLTYVAKKSITGHLFHRFSSTSCDLAIIPMLFFFP